MTDPNSLFPGRPDSLRPMVMPSSPGEIAELTALSSGSMVGLREVALARKVCRDLHEVRALLSLASKSDGEVFRQKALELAIKWGLAVP